MGHRPPTGYIVDWWVV